MRSTRMGPISVIRTVNVDNRGITAELYTTNTAGVDGYVELPRCYWPPHLDPVAAG